MYEWDARKAAANANKHGVTFEEAATVFDDMEGLDGPDLPHSEGEPRFHRLGRAATGRLLLVAYTRRRLDDVENIRIITARQPSRKERASYTARGD
jgi:uncharacterized DUF497 family protein